MKDDAKKPNFREMFGSNTINEILKKLERGGENTISLRIYKRTAMHELYYKKPTIH